MDVTRSTFALLKVRAAWARRRVARADCFCRRPQASLEEKALSELFPGQYEEYASNVPRMVPSLAAGAFETITSGLKRKKQGGLDQ